MRKYPDRYFGVDEWKITEEGFDNSYSKVSESIFSLGNEYMGARGFFEEGYSGETLIGSYFNGVYERQNLNEVHYKGIADITEFMVNSVNWLYSKIVVEGESLDLNTCSFSGFKRELDMKSGVLYRTFIWHTKSGIDIKVEFERFVSMKNPSIGAQKIMLTALNSDAKSEVYTGLDFGTIHEMYKQNFWQIKTRELKEGYMSIEGETVSTNLKVISDARVYGDFECTEDIKDSKKVVKKHELLLLKGKRAELYKIANNITPLLKNNDENIIFKDYCDIKKDNENYWSEVWEKSDIKIFGDELNQQGIRFCIFQMYQTYHGAIEGTNIGAKGLTGEAYNGNAFWDTEVYCLPFYLYNNIKAARNLLVFRYNTLKYAIERAGELDCDGAFYPIATITGRECCNLWQHSNLQLQASTAVAYGIWMYARQTGDTDFLKNYGLSMLIEISKMLATRGDFSQNKEGYGYYGVMGPDEFQLMVHNNFYTNYLGRFTIEYTLEALEMVKKSDEKQYKKLLAEHVLSDKTFKNWEDISQKMIIPYDKETNLYEQHEGYFSLPNVNIKDIPVEDFPLYNNWSYDRIYRNNMIKQPDVLMAMLMFNDSFSREDLLKNYDYYEPKCIHESSLSPSVHSILAAQLNKYDEAYKFFEFATRMDLDNYNRNSYEGLHTTSIAAAWMNIVYGFAGMRTDGDTLKFNPYLPEKWRGYSFRITYKGSLINIDINEHSVIFTIESGDDVDAEIYGRKSTITKTPTAFKLPRNRSN